MRQGRAERNAEINNDTGKSSTRIVLLLVIVFILLAAAGAVAYMYKSTKDSISLDFTDNDFSVEYGSRHATADYVADADGDVTPSKKILDTDSLGEKEVVYTVSKPILGGLLKPHGEYTLRYTVVDTQKPLVLWSGDGVILQKGGKFNISDVIGYGDNADRELDVKYKGKVNMEKAGKYPLRVTVTDDSGNKAEWALTVEVADEIPSYEDDSEGTKFADFVKTYKGEGRSFGIDVSSWQDDIDFEAVKKAGCEFVIIRVGFSTGDDEIATLDNTYKENIKKAQEAGLKVGAYMYSYDNSEEMVRKTAEWTIKQLDGVKLDLPVAFDWEDFGQFQTYNMNFSDLNRMYDVFSEELSKAGYDCILYSSKNYLEDIWEDADKRPVWLAHYTDDTDYEGPYMIWQASNTGRIDGIKGPVDMDIMYEN